MVVFGQNGDTLLHHAIRGGHSLEGLVVVLLQFGAVPDIPDRVRFPFISLFACL